MAKLLSTSGVTSEDYFIYSILSASPSLEHTIALAFQLLPTIDKHLLLNSNYVLCHYIFSYEISRDGESIKKKKGTSTWQATILGIRNVCFVNIVAKYY